MSNHARTDAAFDVLEHARRLVDALDLEHRAAHHPNEQEQER